jgi:predicted nucleotidyltransferase component of viral defense system
MNNFDIIKELKERLSKNDINTERGFRHELREITQELVMAGLSEAGLFDKAVFHGGTALRMVYRIARYSEDLDFTLLNKDENFKWKPYLDKLKDFAGEIGCKFEVVDKSKYDNYVQKAFVKDNSIEQMMNMSWTRKSGSLEKINIKLEVDTNPPLFSNNEIKTYNYPIIYNINIQNLPSLFAGKCHALLCREYDKGRDWFDLNWFVNKKIEPNYKYLNAMLNQQGPWKGQEINTNIKWISDEIIKKSEKLNFNDINLDINKFANKTPTINYDKNTIINIINIFNSEGYGQRTNHENNSW